MIFKQLPTAISDLNKLGIALKSLDAMKFGTVGVNLGNVEAYRTALKGLSVEQSVFALASKGATEEQIRQILVTNQAMSADVEAAMAKAGLTTATQALNAEEMIALATKRGIDTERAKEIASALGLIATEKGQIISKKQLTVATLQQAGATDAEITAILGLNAVETANIGITNVLTASFTKLWAVITAHPIGAILTAIGAVAVGTIAYINKVNKDAEKALVEAHENAEQALEDTKTSLSNDKSELQSVNSELETTKEKIKEISSIGAPTLTEQNELNKLSTANAQLEAQKTLLENNIKLKQKSAALDAKELLGTQVEMEYSSILDNSSITSKKESYTYADHAKYQASNLKNAYNIYMKALEEGNVKRQGLAQELIDASAGDTAVLTSELLKIVESFKYDDGTIIEGYEDLYNEYMGMIYNLQSLTNPDTFLEIAKSVTTGKGIDYEKAVSEAYALAYEGNFDVDNLNQDFVKALVDSGIDESTIDYIFSLKEKEYQMLIDKVSQKYNPDAVLAPTYLESSNHVDTEEQKKQKEADKLKYEEQKQEVQEINDTLTEYAKENPIEFQLITSYDENFSTLDKYIEEEKSKIQSTKEELESLSQNGNVDLTIRPVIDSSTMQAAGWDVKDGSIATTFTQGEFIWQGGEDDGQYVYVHYTPILPDGTVLTPDQLSNYLYSTLESSKNILESDDKGIVLKVDTDLQGVSAEDIKQLQENGIQTDGMQSFLNSMGQWDDSVHTVQESYYDMSGTVDYVDNAIKRLVEDAKKAEGIDTNKTDISISDVFSFKNAENEATILSELNDKLSEVKSAYETCLSAKEEYDEQGYLSVDTLQKVISLGDDYLQYLFDEQGNVKLDAEAFKQLTLARINDMEAQALQNLAENIKQITDEATATEYLAQKQNELASSYTDVAINALLAMQQIKGFSNSEALQGAYNSFKTQYEQIKSLFAHTRSGLGKEFNGISDSAKKATEDAEKATKEYIDSYMDYMEKSLESGRIDYQTYSRDVAKFLKDMYDQGKIAAKDYHDYTKEMLEVQKNAMDSVISAVTNRLDKEIDFYEDQIDAVEERYQTEIDYLDTVIEYYENQKKALQDTNDELDRQKALEEALYNLYQKQTQKTIGLYTADKGKIYTTDASAIRDAEDNVRKAKLDIEIAKLDEAIEKVEQQQDALRDAMDKEKEQLQEIIDRLEEYKEQWQNVAKEYEIVQNEMMASQILGADWESQILSGRIDTLNNFKSSYIAIQQAIADAAWASANAQIEAAKEAQKGANGNTGGADSVGDDTPVSNRIGNGSWNISEDLKNEQKAVREAAKAYEEELKRKSSSKISGYVDRMANGGVVSLKKSSVLDSLAQQAGEDKTIFVKEGERVLTPVQNDMWEKWTEAIPNLLDLSNMIKVNTPDYSKISGMVSKAQTIEQHNQFNVTLPNITDSTKATKLFEELQRLPLDALQYANTRKK